MPASTTSPPPPHPSTRHPTWTTSFEERAVLPHTSPLAAYLLHLMAVKRSNLCVSADVSTSSELIALADEVGDSICLLKTHADTVIDFNERTVRRLRDLARRRRFLVFEDRKFGDIGSTVQKQYTSGPLRIAAWAEIVNAHIFPGPAIVPVLQEAAESAIAAYNSTVHTEISAGSPLSSASASPAHSPVLQPVTSTSPPRPVLRASNSAPAGASSSPTNESALAVDDNLTLPETPMSPIDRKLSVVSISTTISTRTEPLTPIRPSGLIGHRDFIGSGINGGLQPPPPTATANSHASSSTSQYGHHSHRTGWPTDRAHGSNADGGDDEDESDGSPPYLRGLLLLAQMSSEDNMLGPAYTAACVQLARKHRSFVMGFIAQRSLNDPCYPDDNFLTLTPGVSLPPSTTSAAASSSPAPPDPAAAAGGGDVEALLKGDGMGQRYRSPRRVVLEDGVDVVIVGRGILRNEDRAAEAERFRREAWRAYEERIGRVAVGGGGGGK